MQNMIPYVAVLLVIIGIIASGIRVAQEYQRAVVFRLGRFDGIKGPGIYYLMQRAMAREAEAIREKRARIVKAEAELEASIKLTQGAKQMEESPIALELRRMQMLSEIGIDNNTTTIVLIPSEFTEAARSLAKSAQSKEV